MLELQIEVSCHIFATKDNVGVASRGIVLRIRDGPKFVSRISQTMPTGARRECYWFGGWWCCNKFSYGARDIVDRLTVRRGIPEMGGFPQSRIRD